MLTWWAFLILPLAGFAASHVEYCHMKHHVAFSRRKAGCECARGTMGNFSPYSEEWERQRIKKTLDEATEKYLRQKAAFEKLPRPIQALVRAGQP